MNRRSSWLGRLRRPTLLTLLCASQLLAWDGGSEAAEIVPPGAAYLGRKPPGEKPERFAPAMLSAYPFLERLAFSPDGKECFFTVGTADYSANSLFMTRHENGAWTPQAPAPFTAGFERSAEPFFSPDGKRLYFTAQAKGSGSRMDIWMVDRTAQGWGNPTRLPAPVNSDANEFCFSKVLDGTMYFLSNRSGAPQAYRAREKPDQSLHVELIPAPVLSVGTFEGDPCVAPDGRFLVFYSGRAGGFGAVDLYVSFPDGKGEWTSPVNLGPDFNTAAEEFGATLSPDGKYLFFVRHTQQKGEIYWASTRAIEKLRAAGGVTKPTAVTVTLPTHAYVIQGKPSAVVQDHEAVLALALQMEVDLRADLGKYGPQDKSALQRIHAGLYGIALLKKDHAEARRHLEAVRELQENPAARLLTGVVTLSYMQAMEQPGADFRASFRRLLSERLAALPYEQVEGTLGAMKDGLESASRSQLVGGLADGLDPLVQDGRLSQEMASALVSTAMNLEVLLPVKEDVVTCIQAVLDARKTTPSAASADDKGTRTAIEVAPTPLEGPYFGQTPRGDTPEVFAPGIVSLPGRSDLKVSFSSDSKECLIGIRANGVSTILFTRQEDGRWSAPEPAKFIVANQSEKEPFFSPDGSRVFFVRFASIWMSRRVGQSWSTPERLGAPINVHAEQYHPTVTSDGTLYFCSNRGGQYNIYSSKLENGRYATVEKLDAGVNLHKSGDYGSYDPYVAPDGSYLIFSSARPDAQGKAEQYEKTDQFISYWQGGRWTPAQRLGLRINSEGSEYGSYVSPDHAFYFFARSDGAGRSDLYWARAAFIEDLKPGKPAPNQEQAPGTPAKGKWPIMREDSSHNPE